MLELLKNLDAYLDGSYEEAKEKFAEYIRLHGITRKDIDMYIRDYPGTVTASGQRSKALTNTIGMRIKHIRTRMGMPQEQLSV